MPQGEKNRKLSDADRAEIVRLYTTPQPDGTWMGAKTIAARFGVADTTIFYRLKREGVPIRDAKESHAHGKRCGPFKHMEQFDAPPLCSCGCGQSVRWLRGKQRWAKFVPGHPQGLYKDADWLRHQYVDLNRSTGEIAQECGVFASTICRQLRRDGTPIRDASASKAGRFIGDKNPAWKGGVAKWSYAPQWKRIARTIRKRDNYTCQICGVPFPPRSQYLHVHHRDGDKTNNQPDNLQTVCAKCHPKGKRKEAFYTLKDPHWRSKWLVTRKGDVLGVDTDTYLTSREAADRIGVQPSSIVKMGREGAFTVERINYFWYVERASFEAFAATYQRGKHRKHRQR